MIPNNYAYICIHATYCNMPNDVRLHVAYPGWAARGVANVLHRVEGVIHVEHWVRIFPEQAAEWKTRPLFWTVLDLAFREEPEKPWASMGHELETSYKILLLLGTGMNKKQQNILGND